MQSHPRSSHHWPMKKHGSGAFAEKREVIRRMAREALGEDDCGETVPMDDLL
jgi:hypothetical protein